MGGILQLRAIITFVVGLVFAYLHMRFYFWITFPLRGIWEDIHMNIYSWYNFDWKSLMTKNRGDLTSKINKMDNLDSYLLLELYGIPSPFQFYLNQVNIWRCLEISMRNPCGSPKHIWGSQTSVLLQNKILSGKKKI